MDPKKISSLDPKLRETYERVMGTSSPSALQPSPMPNQLEPAPEPPVQKPAEQPQISLDQPQEKPVSGFIQTPQTEHPTIPPIMETQTVQNSPIMQNLNMSAPQEDFTKSPFLNPGGSFANPNPTPEEVTDVNQAVNKPQKQKGKSKLLPVILFLGIIVFFTVYTVVWAKLFNLF